ncbi:MAG: polymer-forming cytoskeletal protein [Bacteroidales bacterium]|nr:polymer-forming cytoskeletal protein [Bacteroidales bacterium]
MVFDPRKLTVIEQNCVVDGDIECHALRLLGKINGNAIVDSFADIEENAEITGELKAGSVRIAMGAKVGKFSLINGRDGKAGR